MASPPAQNTPSYILRPTPTFLLANYEVLHQLAQQHKPSPITHYTHSSSTRAGNQETIPSTISSQRIESLVHSSMNPVHVLLSAEWETAIKITSNHVQSWHKPAARHMKVAAFIAGQAVHDWGRPNSVQGRPVAFASRPTFHPIHCAASQGMVPAVRVLLEQSACHQVSFVFLF